MDRYCPVAVGELPTRELIACGRLLDPDGKCLEHDPRSVADENSVPDFGDDPTAEP